MTNLFFKTRLIYKVSDYIANSRRILLQDLVSYSKDPVRYMRRVRILTQLAAYEKSVIEKIDQFETDDPADLDLGLFVTEVQRIVDNEA